MAKTMAAAAIIVGASTVARPVPAQQSPQDTATPASEVVTASRMVQKIDKASRMVTLKDSQGNTLDVKAGPDVNLGKLKVGDSVHTVYYQELAVGISVGKAPHVTTTTTERGGVTARQTTVTARILSVDTSKNTVTVRDPQGRMHTMKVQDPDLQARLGRVKAGDNVQVTYTQAVAVSVEPVK
jgi:Cu/Ag efflux protein CusF